MQPALKALRSHVHLCQIPAQPTRFTAIGTGFHLGVFTENRCRDIWLNITYAENRPGTVAALHVSNTNYSTKKNRNFHPGTYELSNIILALTSYGRSDEWEFKSLLIYFSICCQI